MEKVHRIGESLTEKEIGELRNAEAERILEYLGFPEGRKYPNAVNAVNEGFFRSNLFPDADKDFPRPFTIELAFGNPQKYTIDDIIEDSKQFARTQKENDIRMILSAFRAVESEHFEYRDFVEIVKKIMDIVLSLRLGVYLQNLDDVGTFMKRKIEEAEKEAVADFVSLIQKEQKDKEQAQERERQAKKEMERMSNSVWRIALEQGSVVPGIEEGTYTLCAVGVQPFLSNLNARLMDINRNEGKMLELPSTAELEKKLRKENGKPYSRGTIANARSRVLKRL